MLEHCRRELLAAEAKLFQLVQILQRREAVVADHGAEDRQIAELAKVSQPISSGIGDWRVINVERSKVNQLAKMLHGAVGKRVADRQFLKIRHRPKNRGIGRLIAVV